MQMHVSTGRVLVIALTAFVWSACGGRQRVEEVQEVVVEDFDCISEMWAEPPPQIGQTPPEASPSATDVDPFLDTPDPVDMTPERTSPIPSGVVPPASASTPPPTEG